MEKHIFDKSILKAYDIRGVVGKTLSEKDAYYVGKSYGSILRNRNKKTCVVGYDGRLTSEKYCEEVIRGLNDVGIDTTCIGLVPSPVVYFACPNLQKNAGLIITASHNPPEYNGFKMFTDTACFWGEDIKKLGELAENGNFYTLRDGEERGKNENIDIKPKYIDFIINVLEKCNRKNNSIFCRCLHSIGSIFDNNKKNNKRLTIVWDAGNGANAVLLTNIVNRIAGNHITICDTVDGNFPNHHPDPSVEANMKMLQEAVVQNKADLGIAFDGDGDRLGIVDSEGYVLYGDQLLDILARDFLRTHPGEKIIFEVKSSKVLVDDIRRMAGIPIMWKPGHSAIKAKMKQDNIKLGGETSGHMYFEENMYNDDSLYASMKLINFLSHYHKTITELRKSFPKTYLTREVRIEVGDERKFEIPTEIAKRMKEAGKTFVDVDGIRVETEDGWWLVRASNTQPDLTTRCESLSESGLEICKQELKQQLQLSGVNVDNIKI